MSHRIPYRIKPLGEIAPTTTTTTTTTTVSTTITPIQQESGSYAFMICVLLVLSLSFMLIVTCCLLCRKMKPQKSLPSRQPMCPPNLPPNRPPKYRPSAPQVFTIGEYDSIEDGFIGCDRQTFSTSSTYVNEKKPRVRIEHTYSEPQLNGPVLVGSQIKNSDFFRNIVNSSTFYAD